VKLLEYASILMLSACSIEIPAIALDIRHSGSGGVLTRAN
jgi:hypothetical protein